MTTETKQSTAIPPTSNQDNLSSQEEGLIRKFEENGMAQRQPSGVFGLPLTPQEMLGMNPFSLLGRIAEESDRILQPFLSESDRDNIAWIPTVEVAQRDGTYHILAKLPGMSSKDLRVEVDDDAVILQGEHQGTREAKEVGIRRSETQFRTFYRRIPFPEGADPEQAKAKFHDGILEITLPAPNKQTEPKHLQLEAESRTSPDVSKPAA